MGETCAAGCRCHGDCGTDEHGPGRVARVLAAACLAIAAHILGLVPLYVLAWAVAGYDVVLAAVRGVASRRVFSENLLMTVATVGAFAIGAYPEAVAVMAFYQVGESLQDRAVGKSRRSVEALADIVPEFARIATEGGFEEVPPDGVPIGSEILIRPGERVPIDCVVIDGSAGVDPSPVTGEHVPIPAAAGIELRSGCVCLDGALRARTVATYGDSTATRIMALVTDAHGSKSGSERFVTRFAAKYTPAVVALAFILFAVPTLLGGDPSVWGYRALLFLVISCPCALVVSVPLSFFGGIGNASSKGILVKGGVHMEALAKVDVVAFDKTGTLTEGGFSVTGVCAEDGYGDSILRLAAHAEAGSNHPISRSILDAHGETPEPGAVGGFREIPGRGVIAEIWGKEVRVGNSEHLGTVGTSDCGAGGTVVHVAHGDGYAGHLHISDSPRERSAEAVASLRSLGVGKIVMLTGDSEGAAKPLAEGLGLDGFRAGLLPSEKLEALGELRGEGTVAFVGDGINDAPALAAADVGIAMGGIGSDAAIEAADVVLVEDDPAKVPEAIRVSRKTVGIARQNVVFALATKGLFMVLGAAGLISMWEAVFADVGVMILAVLNSARALR
ncbi:MAG: cadmium-translocating P-type ATPase [Thermoplasmatales archaeon]|mgnify:CR=1 FL=1|nr:cadmium-translocating P-type ATPase [Thermoplasmatales archaeon]